MKDERVSVALPVSEAPLVNEAAMACILRLRGGLVTAVRLGGVGLGPLTARVACKTYAAEDFS
jgi:hypothetical protein